MSALSALAANDVEDFRAFPPMLTEGCEFPIPTRSVGTTATSTAGDGGKFGQAVFCDWQAEWAVVKEAFEDGTIQKHVEKGVSSE